MGLIQQIDTNQKASNKNTDRTWQSFHTFPQKKKTLNTGLIVPEVTQDKFQSNLITS